MRAHISAPVFCCFNGRAHFTLGELRCVERIVQRCDTPARHDLDLARPFHQLLAHRPQHGVRPVGNQRYALLLDLVCRRARHPRQLAHEPKISVAGGLRHHRAGRENPRTWQRPPVNRHLQTKGRPADIAHGRKTTPQGRARFAPGHQVHKADILCERRHHADGDQCGMPMTIDQAGDHCPPATIAHHSAFKRIIRRHQRYDPPALHHNVPPLLDRQRHAVEIAEIVQAHRLPRPRRPGRFLRQAKAGKHADHRRHPAQHLPTVEIGGNPRIGLKRVRRTAMAGVDAPRMCVSTAKRVGVHGVLPCKPC